MRRASHWPLSRVVPADCQVSGGASAAVAYEIAGVRFAQGDIEGAIAGYAEALRMDPGNVAAGNNLGAALIKAGRFAEAVDALEGVLALRPAYPRALTNLGKALREAGRAAEAVARLREALASEPHHVPALVNLGDALAATGELDAAQRALEMAISLSPGVVEAHMTLGIVHLQAERAGDAIAALRTAVALAPDHPDAHSNLAHALFVSGEWQAAWPHFEYRFRRVAHRSRLPAPAPGSRWDGSVAQGQQLRLIGEQGLGDQLQFARYAKWLGALGMRCTIECDPRLVSILEQAALAMRIVPQGTPCEAQVQWIPLLSLPAWHRTRPDTVPFPQGYLTADPCRVGDWRSYLGGTAGLRVALAWAGNPRMETGRYAGRSPPLRALAPLMSVQGVSFVSLQKFAGEEQLDSVAFGERIRRLPDLDAGLDAFIDTAAVLRCVDLLVTSDTAMAHLGGALGVPTWLCLMREPDWRWMRYGSRTPWYASLRLFRQPVAGDWASVFTEVAAALAAGVVHRAG
jgi:tetratricopeptide (TPR) repeat protein